MKAIVSTQYPQLTKIFDLGDEVEIEAILSKFPIEYSGGRRTEIIYEGNRKLYKNVYNKPTIVPAGSFTGYRIQSKNGSYYDDICITGLIGFKSLSQIFERVNLFNK